VHARNAYTATPGKTSSIAVPVFRGERIAGALSLIFFAAAMPMREAEARYAGPLKDAAARISDRLRARTQAPPPAPVYPSGG